jgi:hypothetical protein
MPQLLSNYLPSSPPLECIPPIPPRTRSRPPSRQQTISVTSKPQRAFLFRLDELPAPDREWQLFENIGDGTYGEVFRVRKTKMISSALFSTKTFIDHLGEKYP